MNEKQRLHQEKEAEVGKVAALEAALDASVEGNLIVMCDVRSIALREGGRQHQNLLRGVARELAPIEGSGLGPVATNATHAAACVN